jgi:XTP/dITP diphosphohydrolase
MTADAGPEAPAGRIVLLLVSPRTAPGLLSWPAWSALRSAAQVLVADLDEEWRQALAEAGVEPVDLVGLPVGERAGRVVEGAIGRQLVWFGSPDGDPGLTDALAEHLSRRSVAAAPPEIEVITGSHDVPGARLLDLVAVMDRLRSPGGCPWDAEQTHSSLLRYLLEEAHEVIEAVESNDRALLREELGDLLLQVVFHARVAEEDPQDPFDVDEVAAGIVGKLVRRHPHVFAGAEAATGPDLDRNWEELKQQEKRREGLFDGIPASLPALARAQKMLDRLDNAGRLTPEVLAEASAAPAPADPATGTERPPASDPTAGILLAAVRQARAAGVDAESALRQALGRLREAQDRRPAEAPG